MMSTVLPQFTESAAPVMRPTAVQFGIHSPENIKAMGTVHVTKPVTENSLGVAERGGLSDPAMGSMDSRGVGNKVRDDPGYFGYIELSTPVYHIGFINYVYRVLQCVCYRTSKLKVEKDSEAYRAAQRLPAGKTRFQAMFTLCKGRGKFDGVPQPKYRKEGYVLYQEFSADAEGAEDVMHEGGDLSRRLRPAEAREILRGITDADCRALGFDPKWARPEWMVISVLPVPPPHVRPSVVREGSRASQDDITFVYAQIIKANAALQERSDRGEIRSVLDTFEQTLQLYVACLFDNEIPGQPPLTQRSGRPIKSIRQRLVGKHGRIRWNLMGKRVDFSARSVITADSTLSIHQVGVPRSVARTLSVPERVTRRNRERLQALVDTGPDEWPGALSVIREDGTRVPLTFAMDEDRSLRVGWVVERHLQDDDVVLFNRQPSLHKMSIMCHRAVVLSYSTFRMNLTCTPPYNADFDGDEMNLHALQTLPAIAEAQELMAVPRLIISAQGNCPVMGIVQDSLLGISQFTKRDCFIDRAMLFNLLMWTPRWTGVVPRPAIMIPTRGRKGHYTPMWTGKQIVTCFSPPEINLLAKVDDKEARNGYASDKTVLIDRGELLMGVLDKKTVGKGQEKGLIHVIMNDGSPEWCRDFINQLQWVTMYWLANRGFTVGAQDTEAPESARRKVADYMQEGADKAREFQRMAQEGRLKGQPGHSMYSTFEHMVNKALNKVRDAAGNAVFTSLDDRSNNIVAMVMSGSKGSKVNISQIIACVGQQNVQGARIRFGFRDRTLPHFTKSNLGPDARGFVKNSYVQGLTPTEFFFHMMAGREGLIDTAVKTAETGYIQRRLIKAMEDLTVRYDGTVRNGRGQVLQFVYGEDGMDGRWIETQGIATYALSEAQLQDEYGWNPEDPHFGTAGRGRVQYLEPDVIERLRSSTDRRRRLEEELERIRQDREMLYEVRLSLKVAHCPQTGSATTHLPVNLERLITNAQRRYGIDSDGGRSDLDPTEVIEKVEEMLKRCVVIRGSDVHSHEAQENATAMFRALVHAWLGSKPVIAKHRLTREALDWVIGEVDRKFNQACVAPGEPCGVVAAQSLGEPCTQMTLNTFHNAGVSAMNVTLGVPRLKELINVSKRLRTPTTALFVDRKHWTDAEATERMLRGKIEYTLLKDVVEQSQLWYDPDATNTSIEEDNEWATQAVALYGEDDSIFEQALPWLLRFRLSRFELSIRNLKLEDIRKAILAWTPELIVYYNDENAPEPIFHIRATESMLIDEDGELAVADPSGAMDAMAAAAEGGGGAAGGGGGGSALDGVDVEKIMRDIEEALLFSVPLRGIENITRVYRRTLDVPKWTSEAGRCGLEKVPVYDTDGSNLLQLLAVEEIDPTKTICNDVVEVLDVLGIEAARAVLLYELRSVLGAYDMYVNYRHLSLLVDVMTTRGYLCAITRTGINRIDSSPLQKATFEEMVEILLDAAAFAERDPLRGVSENILLGQMVPVGTGACDLLLDKDLLQHAVVTEQDVSRLGVTDWGDGEGPATAAHTPGDSMVASPGGFGGRAFSPGDAVGQSVGASPGGDGFTPGVVSFSPSHTTGDLASPGSIYDQTAGTGDATSPAFMTGTPQYDPSSPAFDTSAMVGASSPAFSPTDGSDFTGGGTGTAQVGTAAGADASGGVYSPSSPHYFAATPTGATGTGIGTGTAGSGAFSPTSPAYSPTSPALGGGGGGGGVGTATSQVYSPTSEYDPTGASAGVSAMSPTSPHMGMGSSGMYGTSGQVGSSYAATSPAYSPLGQPAPAHSASSSSGADGAGAYSPTDDGETGAEDAYSPVGDDEDES